MTIASSLTPKTIDPIQDPEYPFEIKRNGKKEMHLIQMSKKHLWAK